MPTSASEPLGRQECRQDRRRELNILDEILGEASDEHQSIKPITTAGRALSLSPLSLANDDTERREPARKDEDNDKLTITNIAGRRSIKPPIITTIASQSIKLFIKTEAHTSHDAPLTSEDMAKDADTDKPIFDPNTGNPNSSSDRCPHAVAAGGRVAGPGPAAVGLRGIACRSIAKTGPADGLDESKGHVEQSINRAVPRQAKETRPKEETLG